MLQRKFVMAEYLLVPVPVKLTSLYFGSEMLACCNPQAVNYSAPKADQ